LVPWFPAGGWHLENFLLLTIDLTSVQFAHTLYEEYSQIGIPSGTFTSITFAAVDKEMLYFSHHNRRYFSSNLILLVIHIPIFPVHHLRLLPFSLALRSSDKISFPLSERVSSSRDPFVFRVGFSLLSSNSNRKE